MIDTRVSSQFFESEIFSSFRFEAIAFNGGSNGTRSSFVKTFVKSIRSNEFNLDPSLDGSDSI